MSLNRLLLSGLCLVVLGVTPRACLSKPPYRQSFFNAYPDAVGSRLDSLPSRSTHCGTCHFAFTGGGPRNPYGAAFEAVMGSFPATDSGRQAALHSIETQDSDGDGESNLTEITDTANYVNTPTFPGLTALNVNQVSGVKIGRAHV